MAMRTKPGNRRRAPKGGCFVGGRFFKGGCFLPAKGDISLVPPVLTLSFDQQLLAAIARLPSTPYTALAMAKVLRGEAGPIDHGVLRGRELVAIQQLRDASTTQTEWDTWHSKYISLSTGIT